MNIDVYILARLDSSRLPEKHLKKIANKPVIHHLIHRIKKSKEIRKIVVCTTNLKSDDKLVEYLKHEDVDVFRGNSEDVLKRILDAAKFFKTDIIIDVEGDKIYTDSKFVDIIANFFKKSQIDYVTGNDSQGKFNPSHWIHGIIPAGINVKAIKHVCNLKKTDNTDTGYREFFTENKFKVKYIVPQKINHLPENLRLFLDYPEDLEMAKQVFEQIGNDFELDDLIKLFTKKPDLCKITNTAVKAWLENYENKKTKYNLK